MPTPLDLLPDEPEAAPWRAVPLGEVVRTLIDGAQREPGVPVVVGVDGRSAGGKSTFAARLAAAVGATVVHTDDVAWYESFFGWDGLLAEHVIGPVRRGQPVAWRPRAWDERGRPGAIEVPVGAPVVVVEGVGATRRTLAHLLDRAVWVQSDRALARDRGILRDLAQRPDPAQAAAFWDGWDAEEVPFLADDRPWDRADLVVCGTPERVLGTSPSAEDVVVGRDRPW